MPIGKPAYKIVPYALVLRGITKLTCLARNFSQRWMWVSQYLLPSYRARLRGNESFGWGLYSDNYLRAMRWLITWTATVQYQKAIQIQRTRVKMRCRRSKGADSHGMKENICISFKVDYYRQDEARMRIRVLRKVWLNKYCKCFWQRWLNLSHFIMSQHPTTFRLEVAPKGQYIGRS